jgi:hypothetical protein
MAGPDTGTAAVLQAALPTAAHAPVRLVAAMPVDAQRVPVRPADLAAAAEPADSAAAAAMEADLAAAATVAVADTANRGSRTGKSGQ